MNSITQSPSLAVDLAHAVMDEHLRRAAGTRRTPRRPERRRTSKARSWPTRLRSGRPATAA
jgi:hypothetical protein